MQSLHYHLTRVGADGDRGLPKTSVRGGQSTERFAFANGAPQVHTLRVYAPAQWKQYFKCKVCQWRRRQRNEHTGVPHLDHISAGHRQGPVTH